MNQFQRLKHYVISLNNQKNNDRLIIEIIKEGGAVLKKLIKKNNRKYDAKKVTLYVGEGNNCSCNGNNCSCDVD